MKYLKSLTIPLIELARNFNELMVEENAKYFTIEGDNDTYWYITDVHQNGTYPCHPIDKYGNVYYPRYVDQYTNVTIHFNLQP